jgi:hypothetical protein
VGITASRKLTRPRDAFRRRWDEVAKAIISRVIKKTRSGGKVGRRKERAEGPHDQPNACVVAMVLMEQGKLRPNKKITAIP